MKLFLWIVIFLSTFSIMEFMAWFTHKFVMHGFLWSLHKDHHLKDHKSWLERNDTFFVFYAVVSMSLFYSGANGWWPGWALGFGILAYGIAYFLVHDVFIHQRFKLFRNANHWYAKGVRRAHKTHHKHVEKGDGECFGMLFVPFKYFKKS